MDNSIFGHLFAPPIPEGDDYTGEDGLLYCGKCHTRKSRYFELEPGMKQIVRVMCKCREDEVKRQEEEEQRREQAMRIQTRRDNAIRDLRLRESFFDKDDKQNPKLSAAMRKYAENFTRMKLENIGLLLYGPVGTGKTFYAACIVNEVCKTHTALLTSFARISERISANMGAREEIIKELTTCDLLVLDDLGAERQSSYMSEIVFEVIDTRYSARKPAIITTNLSLVEISDPQDKQYVRIYDRIMQMCTPILVEGKSRRFENAKERTAAITDFLGL